ncbi:hypothetical protein F2Q68_00013994 [Brassica cretica]|uniref:Uncharacterized protein n=1 Tax=Brassica cretica TaxID=69181 RepID=A0A8S9HQR4_BRACR|nr:hypothetical protein F2Q68_00013994 [Brassica cretica]
MGSYDYSLGFRVTSTLTDRRELELIASSIELAIVCRELRLRKSDYKRETSCYRERYPVVYRELAEIVSRDQAETD